MEKPTDEAVNRFVNRIGTLRKRLSQIEKIGRLKDLEEWQAMKPLLEDLASMHGKAVDALVEYESDMDDHEMVRKIRAQQSARDSFKWVVSLVDKPKDEADKLRDNIEQLEVSLRGKKEEMEAFGLNK